MLIQDFKRKPDENEEQFLWRICQAKDNGILEADWNDIADVMNEEFREDESEYRGESAYRKSYQHAKKFFDSKVFSCPSETFDNIIAAERELKIATQKLRDERTDYQRSIRQQARTESFLDMVKRVMSETVEPIEFDDVGISSYSDDCGDNDIVACLSDLHNGIKIKNAWNAFNEDILRRRLEVYRDRIIEIKNESNARDLYLVLGGDNISGLIHDNLRLENNENVIRQIKDVSLMISSFIASLRPWFENIYVYSVAGNHGRTDQDKKRNQKGENFDELVPFHLSLLYARDEKVHVVEDKLDETVGVFCTRGGKYIAYVHGDYDSPENALPKLTLMLGYQPDAIIMGHRHHNSYNSVAGSKIIQVGSMVGVDNHCINLRINGKPEQMVFVTNKDQVVDRLYDVTLR